MIVLSQKHTNSIRTRLSNIIDVIEGNNKLILLSGMIVIFMFLIIRDAGMLTICASDETNYRMYTTLRPMSEAIVPDYLYFTIYSATQINSEDYLAVARFFNAFFYVMAAPFIYLISAKFCSKITSTFIALTSILGGTNVYTVVYMPEAPYFFFFWVFTWYFVTYGIGSSKMAWIISGFLLGILSLIKPHALLFTPAIIATLFFHFKVKGERWIINGCLASIIIVLSLSFIKFGFSYVVAGKAGLTLMGNLYGGLTKNIMARYGLIDIGKMAAISLFNHLSFLSIYFSLPLILLTLMMYSLIFNKSSSTVDTRFPIYTFFIVACMVAVTAIFQGMVHLYAPESEPLGRMHIRYYNFLLPALLIAGAPRSVKEGTNVSYKSKICFSFPFFIVVVIALYTAMQHIHFNFIDCPEMAIGKNYGDQIFRTFIIFMLFVLVVWIWNSNLGRVFYIWGFTFVIAIFSTFTTNHKFIEYREWNRTSDDLNAIRLVKNVLTKTELKNLRIVASPRNAREAFRALLEYDLPRTSMIYWSLANAFSLSQTSSKWILLCSNYELTETPAWTMALSANMRLVKNVIADAATNTSSENKIVFSALSKKNEGLISHIRISHPQQNIDKIEGLYNSEPWGAWSEGKQVRFIFTKPLPENAILILTATAFGPNLNKPIMAKIGEEQIQFTINSKAETHELRFKNSNRESTVEFIVPEPTSPKSIGYNEDVRSLGIGFIEMEIRDGAKDI